ncbi:MAG: SMI1/KNR4 family protein [Bacteroidales bacterium]|jgi:hypothetical protein|nr:SMI1/KNR4 family protein [Bacteroidales bacterium]
MSYIDRLKQNSEIEYCIGATESEIKYIEMELSIILPEQYKSFLLECGMTIFGDTHIEGVFKTNEETFFPIIEITKMLRSEAGLSDEFIVLNYEVDEYADLYKISKDGNDLGIYGAEITYDENNQSKTGYLLKQYNSFDEYFMITL